MITLSALTGKASKSNEAGCSELKTKVNTTPKQLIDIFSPMEMSDHPQFILVEGLPGIGKSTLLQEIQHKWSTKQLLQKFKLVILVKLCDPVVQQISVLSDLFKACCKQDEKAVAACSNYFFKNEGKSLLLLFDDFDQLPENLQESGLIADILQRQLLPQCGLIATTCSLPQMKLQHKITIKLHIMGLAEEEQRLCIEKSAKGHPQAKELTEYLKSHFIINKLCSVPFNMTALLYLHAQGNSLPSNSADFYHRFICLTIHHHLAKSGQPLTNEITGFHDLPEPCRKIIEQLAKLSFEALNNNKIIFTFEEVKASCPDITATSGAIAGFGLLHRFTDKVITFKFLQFFIQEFLAAYYVIQLPASKELSVLQEKFWLSSHANMFSIYVALTKGQRPAFKQFLHQPSLLQTLKQFFTHGGDGTFISDKFLGDQIKCLHLLRCFYEAGDKAMCQYIEGAKCFSGKTINLEENSLSTYELECIILFLKSSKECVKLNLRQCHIQDHSLHIIHCNLLHCDLTIRELELSNNGLTRASSSAISDLVIHCRVEVLSISTNQAIGEDHSLYNMLSHPSTRLAELNMLAVNLSSGSAIALFTALKIGNRLRKLDISLSYITDEVCDAIAASLKENTSLVVLRMTHNTLTAEAVQKLVQSLCVNNALEELLVSHYPEEDEEKILSLQNEVNKTRENRGCHVKLNIKCLNYIS